MKKLVPVIILVLSMVFAAGCKNTTPVSKASSQTASSRNLTASSSSSQSATSSASASSQAAKAVNSGTPKTQTKTQSALSKKSAAANTPAKSTAQPAPAPKSSSFYDPNPQFLDNCVNINPQKVYYENGNLVMEAFVTNGFNHSVYNIKVNNITVSNHQGKIASASFGMMNGAEIGPKQYILWKFNFPSGTVANKNADLSALNTHADTENDY